MAKKRKAVTRRHSGTSHKRKTTRRRRRMSAGNPMFKALSNPLIGGIAGAIAGQLVKKMTAKIAKDNDLIATAIPVGIAFFLKKKMPFVSAGMVAAPVVTMLAKKISFLNENENISFVSESLLSDPSPYFLDESDEEMILSENTYSFADQDDGTLSEEW